MEATADLRQTNAAPHRSLQQRRAALRKANKIRTRRAQLKRELKARKASPLDLFEDPLCDTMKAYDFLVSIPKVGRTKANRMLTQARISPSKTLGGMTARQRRELLDLVPR